MMKVWFCLLIPCFVFSQNLLYKKTYDIKNQSNAISKAHSLNDSIYLFDGIVWDNSNIGKKSLYKININSGDTIQTFVFGKNNLSYMGTNSNSIVTDDEFIYIIGTAYKEGSGDTVYTTFHKLTFSGQVLIDTLFKSEFTYAQFSCIRKKGNGNFIIYGNKETQNFNLDLWILELTPDGEILWEKFYGGVENNFSRNFERESSGTFLFSSSNDDGSLSQTHLFRTDVFGNVIWSKTFVDFDYTYGNFKIIDDKTILVFGMIRFDEYDYKAWVTKIDTSGVVLWEKFYETAINMFTSRYNYFNFSIVQKNNNFILAGLAMKQEDLFNSKVMLYCLSPEGDSLWARYYKIRNNDNYLEEFYLLNNGDLLFSGYCFADSSINTEDGWLMRTNCLGYLEHPNDSIIFSSDLNDIQLLNYSSNYDYVVIDWDDGKVDTLTSTSQISLNHVYEPISKSYNINYKIIACNDTLKKTTTIVVKYTDDTPSKFMIYPNPSFGIFKVFFNSSEVFDIQVYDLLGNSIAAYTNLSLKEGVELDLSGLSAGNYFLKIKAVNNGGVSLSRIVVIK